MIRLKIVIFFVLFAIIPIQSFCRDYSIYNENVQLTVSQDQGMAYISKYVVDGVDLVANGSFIQSLWVIDIDSPNDVSLRFQANEALLEKGEVNGKEMFLTWSIPINGMSSQVHCSIGLEEESNLIKWGITAVLPQGYHVRNLEYPIIKYKKDKSDFLITAQSYGVKRPLQPLSLRYPSGSCTLNMVMVSGDRRTFFYSAQDKSGVAKNYYIRVSDDCFTLSQKLDVSYSWTSKDGIFELPYTIATGYTSLSWTDAVEKWYRPYALSCPWGQKTIKQRNIPDWLTNNDIWFRLGYLGKSNMDKSRHALNMFPGLKGVHWYSWSTHEFDTFYPDYYPYDSAFPKYLSEFQSLGAKVLPYTNGRLWDRASPSFTKLGGHKYLCQTKKGEVTTEIYASKADNKVACPGSGVWENILSDYNMRIVDDLHTDGIYYDQISCANPISCYNESHQHEVGGGDWWVQSFRQMIPSIRSAHLSNQQAMMTEENAECYCDLFDICLMVNSPHGGNIQMIPLFPLVYSDRFLFVDYCNLTPKANNISARFKFMQMLLWGAQIGELMPGFIIDKNNQIETNFIKNLVGFRKSHHDIFNGGRYMGECIPEGDNPVIEVEDFWNSNMVLAAKWLTIRNKKVIILVNMDDKDHKVKLPNGKRTKVNALSAKRVRVRVFN